jgi:hypothetical protein
MSSLTDRRQSILGRRRTADPATKPKRVRAPRLTKPAVTVDPGDPQAWKEFKPNTLAYARLWLETGELPAETHFVIRERLAPWIAAVQAGGEDLRATLLAVVPPIEPRVPLPTRDWIMPAIGKSYSMELDASSEADVSNLDNMGSGSRDTGTQGGLLTALQTGSAQEPVLFSLSPRAHRTSHRGNGICTTCGTEFEQPRGPSSSFCPDCRSVARQVAARSHMRLIRGALAVGLEKGRGA